MIGCMRDAIYWLRVHPVRIVGSVVSRSFESRSPFALVEGIRILNRDVVGESEFYFDRIRRALELVLRYDSPRFQRIQRYINTIVILSDLPRGSAAWYVIGAGRCYITPKTIRSTTTNLARTLVHESIHARIDKLGVRQSSDRYDRLERRCAIEEVDFIMRLPQSPELEAWIARRKNAFQK